MPGLMRLVSPGITAEKPKLNPLLISISKNKPPAVLNGLKLCISVLKPVRKRYGAILLLEVGILIIIPGAHRAVTIDVPNGINFIVR